MSQPGVGHGQAFDAGVDAVDDAPEVQERTPAQQKYLDGIADAAEAALEHVEQMIKHLQESLEGRRAEAERARAEADGRAE